MKGFKLNLYLTNKFAVITKPKIATSFVAQIVIEQLSGVSAQLFFLEGEDIHDYEIEDAGGANIYNFTDPDNPAESDSIKTHIREEFDKILKNESTLDVFFLYRNVKNRFFTAFVQDYIDADSFLRWTHTFHGDELPIRNRWMIKYLETLNILRPDIEEFFNYFEKNTTFSIPKTEENYREKLVLFLKENPNQHYIFEKVLNHVTNDVLHEIVQWKENHNEPYFLIYLLLYNIIDKNKIKVINIEDGGVLSRELSKYLENYDINQLRDNHQPNYLKNLVRESFESNIRNELYFSTIFKEEEYLFEFFEKVKIK